MHEAADAIGGIDGAGTRDGGAGTRFAGAAAPRLRGMLHAAAFPAAVVAGLMLTAFSPTQAGRLAVAVYGLTCMALFGVSAAYHRSPPGSRRRELLARLDHVSIMLVIAGTYTPLAVLALHGRTRVTVLAIMWGATSVGALARLIWRPTWRRAPRWLMAALFLALGWTAVSCRNSCGVQASWRWRWYWPGASCTPSAPSSTRAGGPTRSRGGSASTRSSMR